MRNFIIKFGGILVDIMAIVTLVGLVISTFRVLTTQGIWAGLGVLWAGLVSFIFVFFITYLLMSINAKLEDHHDSRY
jgi:hypothetical protein